MLPRHTPRHSPWWFGGPSGVTVHTESGDTVWGLRTDGKLSKSVSHTRGEWQRIVITIYITFVFSCDYLEVEKDERRGGKEKRRGGEGKRRGGEGKKEKGRRGGGRVEMTPTLRDTETCHIWQPGKLPEGLRALAGRGRRRRRGWSGAVSQACWELAAYLHTVCAVS